MRRPWLVGSLVVVLTAVAAYGTSTGGGWVFDDHRFVEQNPALDTVDVPAYFRDPETASASEGIHPDIYRPIRTFDYAVDTAVFGRDDAPPFRWENLLLHALAAILVFRLAWRVAGERVDAGLLAGLLFAVHPVAVEAVAWVSSRGDLLALVGMLAALLVLERPGVGRTLLGALLALLACFAKESAVVLPALLLLRDVALPPGRRLPWRTTVARTAVLLFVALGYIAVRLTVIGDLAQGAFPGEAGRPPGAGCSGGSGGTRRTSSGPPASRSTSTSGFPGDGRIPRSCWASAFSRRSCWRVGGACGAGTPSRSRRGAPSPVSSPRATSWCR